MCTVLNVGLAWNAVLWAGSCVFNTEALLGAVELLDALQKACFSKMSVDDWTPVDVN